MTDRDTEITVTLRDLLQFLLRGLLLAGALAVVAGGTVYWLSQREDPTYRAESTLLIARAGSDLGQFGLSPVTAPPVEASAYQVAGESDGVLTEALQNLGIETPDEGALRRLRGRVSVVIADDERDSGLLRVEALGEAPEIASERADAVAQALVAWDRRRARESLSRVIATLEQQIEALGEQIRSLQTLGDASSLGQADGLIRLRAEQQQQLAYVRALIASAEGRLSVIQPASTTARRIAPRPLLDAVIAALIAVMVSYGVLLLRRAFDTQLRSSDDVAAASGLSVLAEIPKAGRGDMATLREASSYLRTNLMFSTPDAHPKIFMVTSALEGEGKTTVARHLAENLVRNGHRTLLVDADLRSPSIAEAYGVSRRDLDVTTTGEWIEDPEAGRARLRMSLPEGGQLYVVPQFEPSARAAQALSRGFRGALQRWEGEEEYDVIVIDTAPILAVADTLSIAPFGTGTVLVVDPQESNGQQLRAAVQLLERIGVRLLGVVVNNAPNASARTGGYGYGYGVERGAGRRDRQDRGEDSRSAVGTRRG